MAMGQIVEVIGRVNHDLTVKVMQVHDCGKAGEYLSRWWG
jgi:hypothetical protein